MFANHRHSSINNAPTHNAIKVNLAMKMLYDKNERGFSLISRIRTTITNARDFYQRVFDKRKCI